MKACDNLLIVLAFISERQDARRPDWIEPRLQEEKAVAEVQRERTDRQFAAMFKAFGAGKREKAGS